MFGFCIASKKQLIDRSMIRVCPQLQNSTKLLHKIHGRLQVNCTHIKLITHSNHQNNSDDEMTMMMKRFFNFTRICYVDEKFHIFTTISRVVRGMKINPIVTGFTSASSYNPSKCISFVSF